MATPGTSSEFVRHRGPITGVAPMPGVRKVVTSGYDSAVGLFDLDTKEVALLGYHRHLVNRIIVNDEGTRAASCSSDYSIGIWDLESRQLVRTLFGHNDDVEDFVFINPSTGISASRDRRILIWDLETGAIRKVLDGHERDVLTLSYHDGRIYSSGDDMTLRVWELESGALLRMWGPFEHETDTCAIDPVRRRVVLGCDDGNVRVFDTESGDLLADIDAHRSGVKKVAVSPSSGDILSAAYDQRMLVWSAEDFAEKLELANPPSTWERSLTWSLDGAHILGGTFDGTVQAFSAMSGQLELEVGDQRQVVGNACFNDVGAAADGTVVTVSDDGFIRLGTVTPERAAWHGRVEPASGRMLMNAVTLDSKARRVVAGSHDNKLFLYDCDGRALSGELEVLLGEGPVNSVAVAHHAGFEGQILAGCYSGAIVRVTADGQIADRLRIHDGAVKSLRLHPSDPLGVSCGADGLLLSWNLDGEVRERYVGHTAIINDVDIAPSGNLLASVSRDFTVKLYDIFTGRLVQNLPIGRRSLKSVCFWSDERLIIGDYWGTVIAVDLASERVTRRAIARNGISSIARCGDHLVCVSYDGGTYLLRPGDLEVVNSAVVMNQRLDTDASRSAAPSGATP